MRKIKILLVGADGYATAYVDELLNRCPKDVQLVGIVEKYLNNCSKYNEIIESGIPTFETMEDFFKWHSADLAIISTPPFLHCEQSLTAIKNGANVLVEKPLTTNVEEATIMAEYERRYNKFIAVGYQWSFSNAIQELKKDIFTGLLGNPISMKTVICWPRSIDYFNRGSGWGGKLHYNGKLILDSIASNACAHYIHNMLFLLGDSMQSSIQAKIIDAQCLRANNIESFDTCTIHAIAKNNTELFFAASHATEVCKNPQFEYKFSDATVYYSQDDPNCSTIKAVFNDGSQKDYGNPFENDMKKLYDCINAIHNKTVPICTAKTAIRHTEFIVDLFNSTTIKNFNKNKIKYDKQTNSIYVEALYDEIIKCYEDCTLLSKQKFMM